MARIYLYQCHLYSICLRVCWNTDGTDWTDLYRFKYYQNQCKSVLLVSVSSVFYLFAIIWNTDGTDWTDLCRFKYYQNQCKSVLLVSVFYWCLNLIFNNILYLCSKPEKTRLCGSWERFYIGLLIPFTLSEK